MTAFQNNLVGLFAARDRVVASVGSEQLDDARTEFAEIADQIRGSSSTEARDMVAALEADLDRRTETLT